MYVPGVFMSNRPVTTICEVRFPSSASLAIAPGSTYVAPVFILYGFAPFKVMTGGVFTGGGLFIEIEPNTTVVEAIAVKQLFVAIRVIGNTPAVVGVPEIIFVVVEKARPAGNVVVPIEYEILAPAPVDVAKN